MGKYITFSNYDRAAEVAASMNPNNVRVDENQTRGSSYHSWVFSPDAVIINYEHGEGKRTSRFARQWLIKGTAWQVGRDETNLGFYDFKVIVPEKKNNHK